MIPRKKRIAIMIVLISVIIVLLLGVFALLYLKTDMFKSNQNLFLKYFTQSFENLKMLENEDILGINQTLSANKYDSELIRKYRIYRKHSNK